MAAGKLLRGCSTAQSLGALPAEVSQETEVTLHTAATTREGRPQS